MSILSCAQVVVAQIKNLIPRNLHARVGSKLNSTFFTVLSPEELCFEWGFHLTTSIGGTLLNRCSVIGIQLTESDSTIFSNS